MKPTKGLSQDTRPESQPEGTYPFGKNGLQFDLEGSVTNEPGFKQLTKNIIPAGYTINGILETDTTQVLVFFTNDVNSGVKLYDLASNTVSFSVIDTALTYKLGFKAENYITGQVQRNNLGELVCAFTDKVTFPKFLNLDNPQIDELRSWNLFPECIFPTITKSIESGGYLSVGSYFFAVRYTKLDGTVTGFSEVSSGIAIVSDTDQAFADKAIQLLITNADPTYDFIEVAVISKISGIVKASLMNKIPIVSGVSNTTFTGNEVITTISVEEVLINPIFYNKVGTIGQLNDALYVGKLEKSDEILDMQKYANLVQLLWTSELIDVQNCPEEHKSGQKKGFMHGETYAFYIRYKLSNGNMTIAHHIPGVEADATALGISSVATAGGLGNTPLFKAQDYINTFSSVTLEGFTGPYYNDTEVYPITDDFNSISFGGYDLRGERVRHHKMPSLRWCQTQLYSAVADYGCKKLDILGVKAINVIIPTKYTNQIIGYEILYAKRNLQNMTIYGQGLALYGATYLDPWNPTLSTLTDDKVYSNGNNWAITNYAPNQSFLRFHSFDVLFNKPKIAPSFIAAQYKLTTPHTYIVDSYSYTTGTSMAATGTGFTITLMDSIANATVSSVNAFNINALKDPKYLLNDTNIQTLNANTPFGVYQQYSNGYLETAYSAQLLGPPLPMSTYPVRNIQGNWPSSGPTGVENYLTNLCDTKINIYEAFYTQELVSAGDVKTLTDSSPFWGGDIFLSQYTFHTYGILDYYQGVQTMGGVDFPLDKRGHRVVNRFICETVANLYTRYEIPGNIYSKWYPHNILGGVLSTMYPIDYNGHIDPNQVGFTKGAEAINDFAADEIFNPYQEYINKFPYRIHRGGKLSRQTTRSWRTFLALDYYEMQKNMGFIEHLEGMDDRMLVHMTNSLFVSQDKGKLEAGMLSITLGAGDIFQFEPQEAQSSKLGYAGTQHSLSCIRTPIGYVFADSKQGELYLYKPKELTLLNTGMHRFLRDYLKIFGKNPFTGNGITLGWDQRYKRILATVKNIRPADGTNVVIINSPADILEIVGIVGPPNYDYCLITTNGTVKIGDVIFYQGKYLTYLGLSSNTAYSCPEDPCNCIDPYNLKVILMNDQVSSHVTWGGVGTFSWNLYEVGTFTNTLVQSGTSSGFFVDLTTLLPDTAYKFDIWSECGPECVSEISSIQWSTSHVVNLPRSYCLWYAVNPGNTSITVTLMDQLSNPTIASSNIPVTIYKVGSNGTLIGTLTGTITTGNYSVNISVVLGAGEYLAAGTGYAGTITDPSYCGFGLYVTPPPTISYKFHLSSNLNLYPGWSDTGNVEVLSNGVTYTGSFNLNSISNTFTAVVNLPAPSGPVIVSIDHNLMVGPTSVTESGTGSITLNSNNYISLTYS